MALFVQVNRKRTASASPEVTQAEEEAKGESKDGPSSTAQQGTALEQILYSAHEAIDGKPYYVTVVSMPQYAHGVLVKAYQPVISKEFRCVLFFSGTTGPKILQTRASCRVHKHISHTYQRERETY